MDYAGVVRRENLFQFRMALLQMILKLSERMAENGEIDVDALVAL